MAAAGAVAVAVGMISFTLGRTLTVREPVAAPPELVTSTIALSAPPATSPPSTSPAGFDVRPCRCRVAPSPACTNPVALGVSRLVEIDTAGGPNFGYEHFKQYDFLRDKEVVLTFDDGPWPGNTPAVLKALTDNCTKATFFEIGEARDMAPRNRQAGSSGRDDDRQSHLVTQGLSKEPIRRRS